MEHKISNLLIKNYLNIKRDLPWRNTSEPYKIWLSEVILQQTRVNQGLPYYLAFVEKYPDVRSLASASEDDVLKVWQGLGYYSRARNMLRTARLVYERFGNKFPSAYHDLMEMKGIGPYTASAVASFAGNEPCAVVDGNVNRVIARLFGIRTEVDSAAGKKQVKEAADAILDVNRPGLHNQAIMEHGALVCTPKKPHCAECPLQDVCVAFAERNMELYPLKKPKKETKKRHLLYVIFDDGKHTLLQKRDEKDIWGGLFEFPLQELTEPFTEEQIERYVGKWQTVYKSILNLSVFPSIKHILSHQILFITFMKLHVKKLPDIQGAEKVAFTKIEKYAFPIVTAKFLNSHFSDRLENKV